MHKNILNRFLSQAWQYAAAAILGFFLVPFMLGVVLTFSSISEIMIHRQPAKITDNATSAPVKQEGQLETLILLGNNGTEVTDLMASSEILSASGKFHVFTAAPVKTLSPTTGAVSILPDYSLKDAPPAQVIVIPPVLGSMSPETLDHLKKRAESAKQVLCLGEGARLCASLGILDGKEATTHFIAQDDLVKSFSAVRWVTGKRAWVDGNIITSSGMTASMDAALLAVEKAGGPQASKQVRESLRLPRIPLSDQPSDVSKSDIFLLFLHGGFDWDKKSIDVLLYPDVSEIGLAAALDTFPRTFSIHTNTVSPERKLIRTQHGLQLVATQALDPDQRPDLLIVPSGPSGESSSRSSPLQEEAVRRWIAGTNVMAKSYFYDPPGTAFDQSLQMISTLEGSRIAAFCAKMVELPSLRFPENHAEDLLRKHFWMISLLGMALASIILSLWQTRTKTVSARKRR